MLALDDSMTNLQLWTPISASVIKEVNLEKSTEAKQEWLECNHGVQHDACKFAQGLQGSSCKRR